VTFHHSSKHPDDDFVFKDGVGLKAPVAHLKDMVRLFQINHSTDKRRESSTR